MITIKAGPAAVALTSGPAGEWPEDGGIRQPFQRFPEIRNKAAERCLRGAAPRGEGRAQWLETVIILAAGHRGKVEAYANPPTGSQTMTPAFETRDLTKIYKTGEVEVYALRGVDLRLPAGEMSVLLGASGSGKSTLLNILGGLDTPTSGQVLFEGEDLTGRSQSELTRYRRDHVGFVFQFYNLVPSLTARENVALVTEIAPDPMDPREALARVGLQDRVDHFPAQLSGGEQQRVAIARAIAKNPKVLLCDEPTGALDSQTGIQVLEALTDVNEALGTTTVLITHNVSIQNIAHRVIRLADGQVMREEINAARLEPAEVSW